jgi:hypothetical protein
MAATVPMILTQCTDKRMAAGETDRAKAQRQCQFVLARAGLMKFGTTELTAAGQAAEKKAQAAAPATTKK